MMLPKLQFDFHVNNDSKDQSIIFTNPVDIITTHHINEVQSSFNKIKLAVNNGYYVAGYVSYEATYALYNKNRTIDSDIPLLWFGVFNEPSSDNNIITDKTFTVGPWTMHETKETYIDNVQTILQRIHDKQ